MTGRTDRQLGDRAWGSDISSAGLHSRWFRELRDRRFGLQSTCFCDPIRLEGYESSGPGVILVHKWLGGVAGPRPNGRCQLKRLFGKSLKIIDAVFWTDYYVKLHNRNIGFHDPTYRFNQNEIAFVHIPKTGGASLHNLLDQDEFSRFVNLNMHRPISQFCEPGEYSYITIMRDPVKRVWSYYQMVLKNPSGFPYTRISQMTLAFLCIAPRVCAVE